jgi:hypothetical protein
VNLTTCLSGGDKVPPAIFLFYRNLSQKKYPDGILTFATERRSAQAIATLWRQRKFSEKPVLNNK